MFKVNDDMSIYCTRGDCGTLVVTADVDGAAYIFQPEDIVRLKVFCKKECASVVLQRELTVGAVTQEVAIYLSGAVTKIGDIINKPVDYWYEVELNPYTEPRTIIGYDEDGAKLFRLYPEGKDVTPDEEEELPQGTLDDLVAEALARAKATGMFDGEDGQDGEDGRDGQNGYTPVKGVDYNTAADKAEMVRLVLAAMPEYAGETEDIA